MFPLARRTRRTLLDRAPGRLSVGDEILRAQGDALILQADLQSQGKSVGVAVAPLTATPLDLARQPRASDAIPPVAHGRHHLDVGAAAPLTLHRARDRLWEEVDATLPAHRDPHLHQLVVAIETQSPHHRRDAVVTQAHRHPVNMGLAVHHLDELRRIRGVLEVSLVVIAA